MPHAFMVLLVLLDTTNNEFTSKVTECLTWSEPRRKQGLQAICTTIEEKYLKGKVKMWMPGHTQLQPLTPVLVAIVVETVPNIPVFLGFKIKQINFGDVSKNAKTLFDMEKEDQYRLTDQESVAVRKFMSENAEKLMEKHSNLLIIRGSKANLDRSTKLRIALYVPIKGIIPYGEEPFPEELDGFEFDVREGFFSFAANPYQYFRSLMMGCYIESGYQMGGSLGGFVKLTDGTTGVLTACHIFQPHIDNILNKSVFQHKVGPTLKFGEVVDHCFAEKWNQISIDAALVQVTDEERIPRSGRFPDAESVDAGFSPENPMVFNSGSIVTSFDEIPIGCKVSKYGAASEHTEGLLYQKSVAARDNLGGHVFYGQMEVIPRKDKGLFATNGDSGSLAFLITDSADASNYHIRALGMYIGSYNHGGSLITPIWAILQKFNLPLRLMSFLNPQNVEPMEEESLRDRVETLENQQQKMESMLENVLKNFQDLKRELAELHHQTSERFINDKYQKNCAMCRQLMPCRCLTSVTKGNE